MANTDILFFDIEGEAKTVARDKAQQLLAYIDRQIAVHDDSIRACIALRDKKGEAEYTDKKASLTRIAAEISVQLND